MIALLRLADGQTVRFPQCERDQTGGRDGKLFDGMTVDGLHLSVKGYRVWANALKPILTELLYYPQRQTTLRPSRGSQSKS